jgi:hypothetical protein
LKDNWKEGQEKHVDLVDHEPEALEDYINWLYTQNVTLKDAKEKCKHHRPSAIQAHQGSYCSRKHCLKLAKMYILGDYLNDMQFCNAVIGAMGLMQGCVLGRDAIEWVRNHTPQRWPCPTCCS